MSNVTILYFGNDWGAENRTSSHHVARWLANRCRVYYVESPGLRAPQGSARDVKKIVLKLWRFCVGPKRTDCGIKVLTLVQIPLHRFAFVRRLNELLVKATLRWLMWREGIHEPITWFVPPHLPYLVGDLGERVSVYYCIDDYASFPNVDPQAIGAMDDETTRKADIVFVASDTLLDRKLSLNPHTYLSPHGVDYEHFARAQDPSTNVPRDVAELAGPVVGFFGLVERWIDLDLIGYLARERPQWTFLLIGRIAVPVEQLPRSSNLHYLGVRPYESLPSYGRTFDVSIIPYRLTQQVLHANPIKLREYLAMGKPVVSVSTPEVDKYADVVEIAQTREQFLARLDAVLSRPSTSGETRRRMERVASESWDTRLSSVWEIASHHERGVDSGELVPTTETCPLRMSRNAK